MRSLLLAVSACAVALALSGCAAGADAPIGQPPELGDPDLHGLWSLSSATVDGARIDPSILQATVLFTEGNARVMLGCIDTDQSMSGGLVIRAASMMLTTESIPQASCIAVEDELQSAIDSLGTVSGGSRVDDRLTLTGANSTLEFELVPAPAMADVVGNWTLASVMQGDHGVVEQGLSPATIDIADDGRVSGSTSCGAFSGVLQLDSGLSLISGLEYFSGSCIAGGTLDADVHEVLDYGFIVAVHDEGLTLTSSRTTKTLFYARAA